MADLAKVNVRTTAAAAGSARCTNRPARTGQNRVKLCWKQNENIRKKASATSLRGRKDPFAISAKPQRGTYIENDNVVKLFSLMSILLTLSLFLVLMC